VSKGFTQREGIDYTETFSPMYSKDSLRIIIMLVTQYDLELYQIDVKTIFLNDDVQKMYTWLNWKVLLWKTRNI
jgi:hypothetical protein